ncbi:MAG: hypothetical protein R3C05_12850 [Pirellulaceae bacterium]
MPPLGHAKSTPWNRSAVAVGCEMPSVQSRSPIDWKSKDTASLLESTSAAMQIVHGLKSKAISPIDRVTREATGIGVIGSEHSRDL